METNGNGAAALKYKIYTPTASGGGDYRHPGHVYVIGIDPAAGPFGNIRSRCVAYKKLIAANVDRRYGGPRSANGQALAEAKRFLARLVAEQKARLSAGNAPEMDAAA